MDSEKFRILIQKYQNGELQGEQKLLMDQWFEALDKGEVYSWTADELEALGGHIMSGIRGGEAEGDEEDRSVPFGRPLFRRWLSYAAAILVFSLAGTYLYVTKQGNRSSGDRPGEVGGVVPEEIRPGGQRATLTFGDGRTIALSEEQTGIVVGGDGITYEDGSPLHAETITPGEGMFTLSTPRGGTYRLTLADGTQVWLNAASSLRYPGRFAGASRMVRLEGEAFFHVRRQTVGKVKIPFLVKAKRQVVEVLGTQFSVSAYEDEPEVKTILVEGKVRVVMDDDQPADTEKSDRAPELATVLEPGQEAVLTTSGILMRKAHTEAVAWKAGFFCFEDTSFEDMMRQIARWYDIEVTYKNKIPDELFSGKMSRSVSLQVFMDFLRDSGVRSRLQGRRLIIGE